MLKTPTGRRQWQEGARGSELESWQIMPEVGPEATLHSNVRILWSQRPRRAAQAVSTCPLNDGHDCDLCAHKFLSRTIEVSTRFWEWYHESPSLPRMSQALLTHLAKGLQRPTFSVTQSPHGSTVVAPRQGFPEVTACCEAG